MQDFDTDPSVIVHKKNIVSDWKTLLQSDLKKPDYNFPDILFIDRMKKKGMVLEGIELADAAAFIKSSQLLRNFCMSETENSELLGSLREEAEKIEDLSSYAGFILKELNPDGTVKDDHPLLQSARARIAAIHKKIGSISSGFINDSRDILQSNLPSQRDGRTVLALKSNFRGRIKGLVHEVSSTGSTVFIEPFELVDLNNDLAYEQSQLKQQTFRIYRSLTEKLQEKISEFRQLVEIVSKIDTYFARARYSIENRCSRPDEITKGIKIVKGRHPLLGKSAVPISLSFTGDTKALIITGPNAGGKTVTLKTCGLFVLMNQFACELPCEEDTALSIYDNVYADIGDDQSIEASLSTFSGHMSRVSDIIKKSDEKSLVLLDELGSGTDPVQGSAIAVGIMKDLLERNVSSIITTHHASVKNFGYTNEGAVNASVDFDSVSLKPTYRIIEGIPGESHAFEIAQSCGIPGNIIESAEGYLNRGESSVSGMIRELESRQISLMKKEKALSDVENVLKEDKRRNDLLHLQLKQQKHILKTDGYRELKRYVDASRSELENLVRELREGEINRENTRKVKEFIKETDSFVNSMADELEREESELSEPEYNAADFHIQPGTKVIHKKNRKKGTVIEKRKDGDWTVAFGNIRLNVKETDLLHDAEAEKKDRKVSLVSSGIKSEAVFELDLRGSRAQEAENALARQMDAAILSGIKLFHIIHGLGDGILQRTVHDYLSHCRYVEDYTFSDPEHGGYGKTIVRLK